MLTILWYSLLKARGQILGWGLILALLLAYLAQFYDMLIEQSEQLLKLIQNYPPEMMAFFGGSVDLFTPGGYLHMEFFSYMPIILGIYSLLAGSGLLASDEESGALDLVLAHPLSRTQFFAGRLVAFILSLGGILALAWLGVALVEPSTGLELGAWATALPFISLFSILALFGALALFFSMALPSRSMAAMATALLMVASFFISTLARLDESLVSLARFSPFNYYQGGHAVNGLNLDWVAGMGLISIVFVLLAWQLFERRDIRVGGEGGWRFSKSSFRTRGKAKEGLVGTAAS